MQIRLNKITRYLLSTIFVLSFQLSSMAADPQTPFVIDPSIDVRHFCGFMFAFSVNYPHSSALPLAPSNCKLYSASAQNTEVPDDLKKGNIIVDYRKNNSTGYRIIEAVGLMGAPPAEVLRVLTDYAHFNEFMPRITKTEVYHQTSDTAHYKADLDMPWPLGDIWYELSVSIDTAEYATQWRMLDGSILDTRGYWRLSPLEEGWTKATYHVEALLDSHFPEFAVKIAQKKTVKDVLKAVRRRVQGKDN